MSLTKYELETVINFNQAEATASIFTYSVRWQNKLAKLGYKPDMDNGRGGLGYTIPKKCIGLPRKVKNGATS